MIAYGGLRSGLETYIKDARYFSEKLSSFLIEKKRFPEDKIFRLERRLCIPGKINRYLKRIDLLMAYKSSSKEYLEELDNLKKEIVKIFELIDNERDREFLISSIEKEYEHECHEQKFFKEGLKEIYSLAQEKIAISEKKVLKEADLYLSKKNPRNQENLSVSNRPVKELIQGSILKTKDFKKKDLRDKNFEGANLIGANFGEANLDGVNFEGADLRDANFKKASLANVNFREANLERANFEWANLYGANLSKANLLNANLVYAKLENAVLKEANISFSNLVRSYLRKANLSGANLQGANLVHANLRETNLTNTLLEGTNFQDASLEFANFEGSKISGTNFDNAFGLTHDQLENANVQKDWNPPNTKEKISTVFPHYYIAGYLK
jgi:uncharacterized protein YjbI with pentapeptide repeats